MTRPIRMLDLSPRENRHWDHPIFRDMKLIVGFATVCFLGYVIAVLLMGGF